MPVALTGALKAIHRAVCAARGAGDALRVLDFACGYGAIGGIVAPRRLHAGDLRPVWRAPLAHGRCPEPWGGGCRFFCRPARGIRGVRDWRYGHRRGRSRVRGRLGICRSDLSRGPRRRRPERGIEAISGRCDPCIASRFQYRTKGGVSTKCRTQTQNYLGFSQLGWCKQEASRFDSSGYRHRWAFRTACDCHSRWLSGGNARREMLGSDSCHRSWNGQGRKTLDCAVWPRWEISCSGGTNRFTWGRHRSLG